MTGTLLQPRALPKVLLRIAGVLVGVLFVAGGAVFLFAHPDGLHGWWRNYVAPASMIGTGLLFVAYGVSGREPKVWRL